MYTNHFKIISKAMLTADDDKLLADSNAFRFIFVPVDWSTSKKLTHANVYSVFTISFAWRMCRDRKRIFERSHSLKFLHFKCGTYMTTGKYPLYSIIRSISNHMCWKLPHCFKLCNEIYKVHLTHYIDCIVYMVSSHLEMFVLDFHLVILKSIVKTWSKESLWCD